MISINIPPPEKYSGDRTTLEDLARYLEVNIPAGKVKRSRSAACASRPLRLCVDYRRLNRITVPNRYPLLLINDLLDRTKGTRWLTELHLKIGYNLTRIAAGEKWKTAFKIKKGLYGYTVMPFGLTHAPPSFKEMMDTIFEKSADEDVIWYSDDILIYGGETEADHQWIFEDP